MVIQNPKQLVDEFKKSGEFDRLRRQLLTHFANSDDVRPLMSRVEEIARDKLSSDEGLEHKTREAVHSEVMQDMERYPIVERAVADLSVLKDETLLTSIEQYVRNIVRGDSNEDTNLWKARSRRGRRKDEDGDNDDSSDYTEDEDPDDDELLIITDADRRNNAASSSPGSRNDTDVREAARNDRSSLWSNSQDDTKLTSSHATLPRTSPPALPKSADMRPQTPPWPAQEEIKPSLSRAASPMDSVHGRNGSRSTPGVPSSDSLAGDLLVNGVPVGGLFSDDANEGKAPAVKEVGTEHQRERGAGSENAHVYTAFTLGQGEHPNRLDGKQEFEPPATKHDKTANKEKNDAESASNPSRPQSVSRLSSVQLALQPEPKVASSPSPHNSPAHPPSPTSSFRSLTRSASPLSPPRIASLPP